MGILGKYDNGNYSVALYSDGTKIRFSKKRDMIPAPLFPESVDLKITNYCDLGCGWCHENSDKEGAHGDIMNHKFINTLEPFTEVAIGGGNPMSHPDIREFLILLKSRGVIANMTVNQQHFLNNVVELEYLVREGYIHGLGISLISPTTSFMKFIDLFPTAVLHVINGVVTIDNLEQLYDKDLNILILGFKSLGRGEVYTSSSTHDNMRLLKRNLVSVFNGFKTICFDNLAIEQLNIKDRVSPSDWEKLYMGDDGQYTMYIDAVREEFASSSTSKIRYGLTEDIREMFKIVRMEKSER